MSATYFDKSGVRLKVDGSGSIMLSTEHPLARDAAGVAELEPYEAVELAYALLTAAGDKAAPIPLAPQEGEVIYVALDARGYRVYGRQGTVAHRTMHVDVQLPSGAWMPISRLHKGDRWRFRVPGKDGV